MVTVRDNMSVPNNFLEYRKQKPMLKEIKKTRNASIKFKDVNIIEYYDNDRVNESQKETEID